MHDTPGDIPQPNPKAIPYSTTALRQLAEERLCRLKSGEQSKCHDPAETRELIRELSVHQIELEMQNDELLRTNDELEAIRTRYFDLYNQAPVGYCTLDEKGLITEANLTAAKLLGHPPAELLKQPFSRFILDEDQNTYYLFRKRLIGTTAPQICEVRLLHRNETSFWTQLESTIGFDYTGKRASRVIVSDISNLKRDADELQEMHRQNQEILDSITDGFISFTNDMIIRYLNTAAERILGKKRADVIGKNVYSVFPDSANAVFQEKYGEAMQTQTALSFEHEVTAAPYQNWYGVRIYPDPKVTTVYFQVITERKMMEKENARLASVNRQLQKADSLGRMAGAIAHHFNNRLHAVMGHLELAIHSLPDDDPAMPSLTIARKEADRAGEMSRVMLTYLGQVTEKQERLELSEMCRKILPLIEFTLPKNVTLSNNLQFPSPIIKGNADQIRQILANLIINAWEAIGDAPSTIDLVVNTVPPGDISPSNRFPADWQPDNTLYACLQIHDNGCGIDRQNIEEIFSPFYTTKFTGRGLGLSVVLGLVKAHGGVITAESVPGKGSVFRVFLPILREEHVPEPCKESKYRIAQEGDTVLLVDDDRTVLEVTGEILSIFGFTVLKADDGQEAVDLFRQYRDQIRFVLSDVVMPRMNGWETLLALREISPVVPVILASGYNQEQTMEGVNHAERPQAFLNKPYNFQDLRNSIQRILASATN